MKKNPNFIYLKPGQFLGDVLDFLPHGIIDKTKTAIGGTTHELESKRDSFIVPPFKSIANCKKQIYEDLIIINGDNKNNDQLIKEIKKQRNQGKYIKIMTTPESTIRGIAILKESGVMMENFFLLLDEIHLYQTEAHYRNGMGSAIEVYKNHPKKMRAMLTSTYYPTIDPDLQNEQYSKVICEIPRQEVEVFSTNNLSEGIKKIWGGERFVFINSIIDAKRIEAALDQKCNIYCSDRTDSRKTAGESFRRFSEPLNKVNIYTSAYFTGYDINEAGDIIIVVDSSQQHTLVNMLTMVHICGRLRGGTGNVKLLVISKKHKAISFDREIAQNKLLNDALMQIEVWETMLKYGLINDDNIADMEKVLEKSIKYDVRLIRSKNNSYKAEVDNHAIDGLVLHLETQQLYSSIDKLINGINDSKHFKAIYKGEIMSDGINEDDYEKLREMRNMPRKVAFDEFVALVKTFAKSEFNKSFYKVLVDDFRFSDSDYRVKLAEYYDIYGIQELISTGGNVRILNRGIEKARSERLAKSGDVVHKIRSNFDFPKWYSNKHIKEDIARIIVEFGINRTVTAETINDYFETKNEFKYINGSTARGKRLLRPR